MSDLQGWLQPQGEEDQGTLAEARNTFQSRQSVASGTGDLLAKPPAVLTTEPHGQLGELATDNPIQADNSPGTKETA